MKKNILLLVLIFASFMAKAQMFDTPSKYAIGFGGSIIRAYTSVQKQNPSYAANANFSYYVTPYVPLIAEVQYGHMSGGSIITDPYKRQFENNYVALFGRVNLHLSELINNPDNSLLSFLTNFYGGAGGGLIYDHIKNQRYNLIPSDQYPVGTYRFPGKDKSLNPAISIQGGYEFKFVNDYNATYLRIDIELTGNAVFREGLDGYNDPPSKKFKNKTYDLYNQLTIGVKYNLNL